MTNEQHLSVNEFARALIAEQGIPASEDEIEKLITGYIENKKISEMLFALEEAQYESPALIFDPTSMFADWWQEESLRD